MAVITANIPRPVYNIYPFLCIIYAAMNQVITQGLKGLTTNNALRDFPKFKIHSRIRSEIWTGRKDKENTEMIASNIGSYRVTDISS